MAKLFGGQRCGNTGNGKYAIESMACTVNTVLYGTGGSRKLYYPEIHRGASHFTILPISSIQFCD
jgi:hypothetical protein